MGSIYLVPRTNPTANFETLADSRAPFTIAAEIDENDKVTAQEFAQGCHILRSPSVVADQPNALSHAWETLITAVYQEGTGILGGKPNWDRAPVQQAVAITAAALVEEPDQELEAGLYHSYLDRDGRMNYSKLLADRLLATIALLKIDPQAYNLITASTEAYDYPEFITKNLPVTQLQYTNEISSIIAFLLLQQNGLIDVEDIKYLQESDLLRALAPKLTLLDSEKHFALNIRDSVDSLFAVLNSQDEIDRLFGKETHSELVFQLIQRIKAGVRSHIFMLVAQTMRHHPERAAEYSRNFDPESVKAILSGPHFLDTATRGSFGAFRNQLKKSNTTNR